MQTANRPLSGIQLLARTARTLSSGQDRTGTVHRPARRRRHPGADTGRFIVLLVLGLLLAACRHGQPEAHRFAGETMGTAWHVTVVTDKLDSEAVQAAIEASLADTNARLSNWDPDSEVSRFSASCTTTPMPVSPPMIAVMQAANEVHAASGGRFDVTLGPLIDLWGFGPAKAPATNPTDEAIRAALQHVGQARLLTLDPDAGTLAKQDPRTGINLSALAKGYGIDAVAQTLRERGIQNYMVEIGGDLVAAGHNARGQPWQIGVETPEGNAASVERIVPVSNKGLATSGDYRNYIERDGVRYSHIIDPVTGRPVRHRTTSATVIADNAMRADAWATAMLVLGQTEGLALAERLGLAVFFISRAPQGSADVTAASSAFRRLLDGPAIKEHAS